MADNAENKALAKPTSEAVDRYEQEFMAGDGTVLYRAKARAHWSLAALVLGLGGVAAAGSITVAPFLTVMTMIGLLLTWILFAVLRVTVSEGTVNIQLGLWGPKIPISSIIRAEATTYRFSQFPGFGIRYSLRLGTMYNMPGDGGNALKITWRPPGGSKKTTWVGTREAPELVRAIEAARRKAISGNSEPTRLPASDDDT